MAHTDKKHGVAIKATELCGDMIDVFGKRQMHVEQCSISIEATLDDMSREELLTILDAVYVDAKDEKRIVAIKPKAPFKPVFQVATTREGSGVALVHDPDAEPQTADQPPPGGQEVDGVSCSCWRRGRVELHTEHGFAVLMAA